MNLPELVLIVAATYGATRFIVVDSLLQTPRNRAIAWLWPEVYLRTDSPQIRADAAQFDKLGDRIPDNAPGWGGKLAELLSCPYCVGWWIGLVMFALYGLDGLGRVGVEVWAIRGTHAAILDAVRR